MSNLIELEYQLLAHDLQGAHLSRILLLRKVDLSITTLPNLCEDLEITLTQADSTLSKVGTLASSIFLPQGVVCFFGRGGRSRVFGLEMIESILTSTDVGQQIEVVVQEIYKTSISNGPSPGHSNLQSCVTFANRLTLGLCKISNSSAVKPRCVLYFLTVGGGCSLG